jgi:hypothetical protein
MLTLNRLKEYLYYSPEDGSFTKINSNSRTKDGTLLGCIDSSGYVMIEIDNVGYLAHRLAFMYVNGYLPDMLDHIDGDRQNNKYANLRVVNINQNSWNRKTPKTNISTGIKGISKIGKKFYCQVVADGTKYKATFTELPDAVSWVQDTRQILHGEFANHG